MHSQHECTEGMHQTTWIQCVHSIIHHNIQIAGTVVRRIDNNNCWTATDAAASWTRVPLVGSSTLYRIALLFCYSQSSVAILAVCWRRCINTFVIYYSTDVCKFVGGGGVVVWFVVYASLYQSKVLFEKVCFIFDDIVIIYLVYFVVVVVVIVFLLFIFISVLLFYYLHKCFRVFLLLLIMYQVCLNIKGQCYFNLNCFNICFSCNLD